MQFKPDLSEVDRQLPKSADRFGKEEFNLLQRVQIPAEEILCADDGADFVKSRRRLAGGAVDVDDQPELFVVGVAFQKRHRAARLIEARTDRFHVRLSVAGDVLRKGGPELLQFIFGLLDSPDIDSHIAGHSVRPVLQVHG